MQCSYVGLQLFPFLEQELMPVATMFLLLSHVLKGGWCFTSRAPIPKVESSRIAPAISLPLCFLFAALAFTTEILTSDGNTHSSGRSASLVSSRYGFSSKCLCRECTSSLPLQKLKKFFSWVLH